MQSSAVPYPVLSPEQAAAIDEKLVEIVSLRHGHRLSDVQLSELRTCMTMQTHNAEALHRFVLTNADEPVFVRCPAAEDAM